MKFLLATSLLAAMLGLASACGTPPPGLCCTLACPLFTPCALTKACPAPAGGGTVAPPGPDPLKILQDVFKGIGDLFATVEAGLPAGSPALNILKNVFNGISGIFATVEAGLAAAGRRKRETDADEIGAYGYGKKKHEKMYGHKSAVAANEAKVAIQSFKDDIGQDLEKLVKDNQRKSAQERREVFKKALEKHGKEATEKLEKVLKAHTITLSDAKEATAKVFEKYSEDAKKQGNELFTVIIDEKLTPEDKEIKVETLYNAMKPEVRVELKLMSLDYIKRACNMASSPFGSIGVYRVPLKVEF